MESIDTTMWLEFVDQFCLSKLSKGDEANGELRGIVIILVSRRCRIKPGQNYM